MGKSKAKSSASGFSLDYSCALAVKSGRSKSKHKGKEE